MYDGLQVIIHGDSPCDQLVQRMDGLSRSVDQDGTIITEYGRINKFDVKVKYGKHGRLATMNGSLHKNFHGNNEGVFSFSDVCTAVDELCNDLGIGNADNHIQNIEFGLNIPSSYPKAVIDAAILYHGRTPNRHPSMITRHKRNENPYKEWLFDQYCVKLYGKTKTSIRYELHIKDMRKITSIGLENFKSLKDIKKMEKCIQYLYDSIDNFVFVPDDREKCLPEALISTWNSCRADSYWEGITTKQEKYRKKNFIADVIEQYRLINWAQFIKREIQEQAAIILEIPSWSASKDNVTFSELGLHGESVAGAKGDSDRQSEKIIQPDGAIYIYIICIHFVSSRHHLPMHQRRHVGSHDRRVTGCHRKRAPP